MSKTQTPKGTLGDPLYTFDDKVRIWSATTIAIGIPLLVLAVLFPPILLLYAGFVALVLYGRHLEKTGRKPRKIGSIREEAARIRAEREAK